MDMHGTKQPDHKAHSGTGAKPSPHDTGSAHYGRLAWMLVLSFIAMFALMYAMVDRIGNAVPNINQFYMAALMTAPMALLEILLMKAMYPDKRKNLIFLSLGAVVLIASWGAIRTQAGVGDRQFLKSMIPHHAGAILMCQQASLSDPEVKALCADIVTAQKEEIARMRGLLAR